MKKIITLGEIMLRLSPPDRDKFLGTTSFQVNYGGGEANVSAALANYGVDAGFITKLPNNEIADSAIKHLKSFGVDTKNIVRGGERVGIYFLENGFSTRISKVIYDRKDSSISKALVSDFDMDKILKGWDVLHVSGITLGIGDNGFKIAKAFIIKAKELGLEVSFDFNYRHKLWTLTEASEKIKEILEYVDIAFAGHLDFKNILGFIPKNPKEEVDILEYYEDLYNQVYKKYKFKYIISSIRDVKSASKNGYRGVCFYNNKMYQSRVYDVEIIDRVGTGDAYTAGFLYGYAKKESVDFTLNFATASAVLKHTIRGDVTLATKDDVVELYRSENFDIRR